MSPVSAVAYLLVVAHGSRRQQSNEEVRALVAQLREESDGHFGGIEAAFLELAEPSIDDALVMLAERGAQHIVVVPYFLAAGAHVADDIPEALAAFQQSHPDIRLTQSIHFGQSAGIGRLILDMART